MNNSSNSSITALVPGGVVTTQNISTVIRPKGNNNSMQFVKIQTPDLSKKAEEQIRVAQESNISKEKIKEVEEEWQNNLLNWKSKRRQQIGHLVDNDQQNNNAQTNDHGTGRKIKTFAEMIEQRNRNGNRLNFNLERYIGSGEDDEVDEDGPVLSSIGLDGIHIRDETDHHQLQTANNNNNSSNNNNHRIDSDCEAHSSISSSYNQPDSKSLGSSIDSPAELHHNHHQSFQVDANSNLAKSPEGIKFCDNNESAIHSSMRESHSISLVASSDSTDQLNSTLKQGINKLPTPSPPVHNNGRNKPILELDTKNIEVSAKAGDESDNSAFEDEEDQEDEEEQKQQQRSAFVAKLKAFEKRTKPGMQEPKFVPTRTVKPLPPPPLVTKTQPSQIDLAKKISKQPFQAQPISQPMEIHPPALTPPISQPPILQSPDYQQQPSPKQLSPQQPSPQPLVSQPPAPQAPVQLVPEPQLPVSQQPVRQQLISEAPVPQPPPVLKRPTSKPPVSQAPPMREEKDRTVLSVSGKKRCSSCTEELGRGAAAFVVESLSLVYHTNCFRCSVCHVNLSNGFRGVDVRVHAGALHCQNCYSKDGLNYSRV